MADGGDAVGKVYGVQIGTAIKQVILHRPQGIRQSDLLQAGVGKGTGSQDHQLLRKLDLGQRGAAGKGLVVDLRNGIRQDYGFHTFTILQEIRRDHGGTVLKGHGFQIAAIGKGRGIDVPVTHGLGNEDLLQTAFTKCIVTQNLQTGGQLHGGKAFAAIEGIGSNFRNGFRQVDAFQRITAVKGVFRDQSQGFGQRNMNNVLVIRKHIVTDFGDALLNDDGFHIFVVVIPGSIAPVVIHDTGTGDHQGPGGGIQLPGHIGAILAGIGLTGSGTQTGDLLGFLGNFGFPGDLLGGFRFLGDFLRGFGCLGNFLGSLGFLGNFLGGFGFFIDFGFFRECLGGLGFLQDRGLGNFFGFRCQDGHRHHTEYHHKGQQSRQKPLIQFHNMRFLSSLSGFRRKPPSSR